MLLLPLLAGLARAQVVAAVPPDATAVTVLVCRAADGCPAERRALAAHLAEVGAPLVDFEAVAAAGPAGEDARVAFEAAYARMARTPSPETAADAREALRAVPLTIDVERLLQLQLQLGVARLAAGDRAGADEALAAAASASGGRVWDLPALPEPALARYLDLATAPGGSPARIRVTADAPDARVFVDGRPVGVAPVEVDVRPGWHRLSVERPGRHGAWVGEVAAPEGRTLPVVAEVPDNSASSLGAAVAGAMRGHPPPVDVGATLAAWGRAQGLRWIRFVDLRRVAAAGDPVPEEVIRDPEEGTWNVDATWLDVAAARFVDHGPGPASLREASGRGRFRFGVTSGYTRLEPFAEDVGAHDHVAVELAALVRLRGWLGLDVRAGLLRSAQLYYLREGVIEHDVFPVEAGVRVGRFWGRAGGPYGGAHALVIVPLAVGGDVFGGWEIAPSSRWRIGVEASGGVVDDGLLVGGRITVGFSD